MSSRQPPPPSTLEAGPHPAAPDVAAGVDDSSTVPWPWRLYAGLTAHLGLPVIAAWIALTIAAAAFLPDFGAASGFGLVQLVPNNTPAIHAQAVEQRLFGSSLADSQALVVEHATGSLSPGNARHHRAAGAGCRQPEAGLGVAATARLRSATGQCPGSPLGDANPGDNRDHLSLLPVECPVR